MKRIIIAILALAAFVFPVCSQDLSGIQNDLSAFMGGLGSQILSQLHQGVLIGEGIGDAEIGDFPHMYFSFSGGAVLTNAGIKAVIDQPDVFQVLNFPGIVQQALTTADVSQATDIYNGTGTFFLYPNARFSFGIGIAGGVELIGQVSWLPQAGTDFLVGLVPMSGVTLNELNATVRLRKVFLSDAGGFPAISVGAGYVYSAFNAGYSLSSIKPIEQGPLSLNFSKAAVTLGTVMNGAGVDVTVSKRFLVFTPYLKLSSWYEWGSFSSSLTDLNATISTTTLTLNPSAALSTADVVFLVGAGIDIKLGPINLNLGTSYDPKLGFPALDLGLGFQF